MTKELTAKTFTIGELQGISAKTMEEHLGLYQGYVKNFNAMVKNMETLYGTEGNTHAIAELGRRLSFEFDGARLHEYYFAQFEGGAQPLEPQSPLAQAINENFPSENPQERIIKLMKNYGSLRGPGWAILYWDPVSQQLLPGFSGEQHQGHFVTLPIVLAIDVWEHAFILDQGAQGKGKYLDAFFENLNWKVIEQNFANAQK
jgi:Fe-Mn family superoxide dismutase